jgi:membrane-associated phospholipid phosphatase
VLIALVVGLAVFAIAQRWPRVDPGAPNLTQRTIAVEVHKHRGLRAFLDSRFDTTVLTGFGLTAALVAIILGALFMGLLLIMIHTNTGLARWDHSASKFGATHATKLSTRLLNDLSQLGGAYVIIPLAFLVGVIETVRLRSRSVFAFLIVVVGGQFLVADVIKSIVGRARPTIDQLAGFSGSSFPSGHATASAACLAGFALVMGRRRSARVKSLLSSIAVGLAVAVALTRVWLGVHWLTDVLAGLSLGWAWFALSSIAFGGRRLRFGAPVEVAEQVSTSLSDEPADSPHSRKE